MKVALALLTAAFGLAAVNYAVQAADAGKKAARVFEMRTYYASPGKMTALHARFREHTNKLFEKHGMTLVGFWSPIKPDEAEKKMVYLLAFPSKQAAEASWKAFQADPDWQAARTESEKGGKLVERVESVYLNPTDYSPMQ